MRACGENNGCDPNKPCWDDCSTSELPESVPDLPTAKCDLCEEPWCEKCQDHWSDCSCPGLHSDDAEAVGLFAFCAMS